MKAKNKASDFLGKLRTFFFGPKPKEGSDCFYCAHLSVEGTCLQRSECRFLEIKFRGKSLVDAKKPLTLCVRQ
jgi:hypothetical protein